MGRQYLGGRTPVLPDSHDNLGSLIDQLEGMIELYNVDVRASLLLRRIGMASESHTIVATIARVNERGLLACFINTERICE